MSKILPEKGGWVMLTKAPPVQYPIEPLSIYYAMPKKSFPKGFFQPGFYALEHSDDGPLFYRGDFKEFGKKDNLYEQYAAFLSGEDYKWSKDQREILERLKKRGLEIEQRIEIRTIWGDCGIEPHEYNIINVADYLEMIDGEHLKINMFSGGEQGELNQDAKDRIFYMRSRGLSYAEALQFVLPAIDNPNVLYLTFHEEYQQMYCREYDNFLFRKEKWEKEGRVRHV